jgi:hypothetical protein
VISIQDIRDALTKCTGYDPVHFPRPSEVMAEAWMEHFAMYPKITRGDLLAAITRYYLRPSQPVPQPADIRVHASEIRRDRFDRSGIGSVERLEQEAICDAKATEVAAVRQRTISEFDFRPKQLTEAESRRRRVERQRKAAPPQPIPERCDTGAGAHERV